ncbi:H-NS histone family protein [Burkholderia sp. JSH-S8]|nr:H-NS histone family protein [Burkholderia sp. JSH-S8]
MSEDYKTLKKQLDALQARAEAARLAELEAVIEQIRGLVAEYDISAEQIYSRKRATKAGKQPAAAIEPKYRNPKTGETWSGRGRAPEWIRNVKNRDRFLIGN